MKLNIVDFNLMASFAFYLTLCIWLYSRSNKTESSNSIINISFWSAFWALGILLFRTLPASPETLFHINGLLYVFAAMIAISFVELSLILTETKQKLSTQLKLFLRIPIPLTFLSIYTKTLTPSVIFLEGFRGVTLSFGFYLYGLFIMIYFLYGIYLLLKKWHNSKGHLRTVLIYTILSTLFTGTIDVTFNLLIIPFINYQLLWAGPLSGFVWCSVLTYAITKHELLDIKIVVSKAGAFVLTTVIALGSSLTTYSLTKHIPYIDTLSVLALVGTWSFLHPKLFLLIYTPIEKKFLKGFYNIQEIISSLSTELLITKNQIGILKTIAEKLMHELETKEPFFIFSHLNESQYKLYNLSSSTAVYNIENHEKFEDFFSEKTGHFYPEDLPPDILRYISPLALPEKSLIFPIQSMEKFHGVFIFTEKLNGNPYSENDIAMINAVFNQLMIVFDRIVYQQKIEDINKNLESKVQEQVKEIEEKHKIETDLAVAHDIQTHLLPESLPQLTGFKFEAMFKPAKSISGDYYDFFIFSESEIGVVIADIVGKGIPAALLMVHLKNLINQTASKEDSPSETMNKLNKIMCSSREFRRHTPVVYGKLNTKTNTFTYCNAGHDAGRYLSGSEFQVLDTGGVPLGLIEDEEYQEETLKLKNKDFITFYTDGVPDARNSQNESFGDEEVEKIIRSFIANPTEKGFTHKLKKKWYDFIGNTPLKDDSTLISIYHTPLDTK